MWPMLLDYSRDECKRILRRLELEAYSAIISAFRAQGDLSREKKKVLQDLQQMLSISTERHRAEVRRAVNDEKLTTVADSSNSGTSAASEWLIEGRRLVPLLPRLVPQTAFTQTATQAAKEVAEKNAQLMNPALTGNKELANQSSTSTSASIHTSPAAKPSRSSSPTSNVVVLPSGTSIHIKGMLNQEEEDEPQGRRQRRSLSIDGLGAATVSTQTQTARVSYTTASSTPGSASPVKITISKSPQGRTIVSQPGGQPPKVILVTSSGQSSGSSVFQRSMSVPVIRASTSTATSQTGATRTSIIIPGSPGIAQANNSVGGVVTVTTTSITTSSSATVTMPTSVVGSSPVFSPSVNIAKPRPKVVPRQRFPQPQPKPGVIIPMGPTSSQPVPPSPQSLHNIQVKTLPKPQPIQIKQEGGMKIITQSMAGGTSKILPKPAQLTGSPGTPVVVVNAGSSSSSGNTTVTMVPKSVGSYTTASGGKVLNITTPGGRVIATTSKASNVVTVNPKTLHLTAVKSAAGGTTVSKPNVIVVQKTQPRRPPLPTQLPKGGTTVITNPAAFEKELANFIQKESGRQVSVSISPSSNVGTITGVGGRVPEHRVIITTAGNVDASRQGVPQRPVVEAEARTSSLLAELIQAAGIVPEGSSESSGGIGGNEWFEYDVTEEETTSVTPDSADATAMQALIGLQNSGAKIVNRSSSAHDQQGPGSQEQCYTLEQAMTLLNQGHQVSDADIEKGIQGPHQVVRKAIVHASKISAVNSGLPGGMAHQVQKPLVDSDSLPSTSSTDVKVQQGELDPQTGLFYSSVLPPTATAQPQVTSRGQEDTTFQADRLPVVSVSTHLQQPVASQTVLPQPLIVSVTAQHPAGTPQPMDLLSSSLAQAQIDLDSYEFTEDGSENYVPETNIMNVVSDGNSVDNASQPASSTAEVVDFTSILLGESDSPSEEIEQTDADIIPQLTQPASRPPSSTVASLQSPWAVANRQTAFVPLENMKDSRTASIKIITHEQLPVDASSFVPTHGSSKSSTTTNGSFITMSSGALAPLPSASVSVSSSSVASATSLATLSSAAAAVANARNANSIHGALPASVASTTTTKPEVIPLTTSRTFVLENAVPVSIDPLSRRTLTVSKPVTELTGTVRIVHDGHTQSEVDSQRQLDIAVLSPDVPASSTADFSSTGDDEVNLISIPDAGTAEIAGDGLDPNNPQRHSKRKRKPPPVLEEDAVGSTGSSWVRAASNILMRVSRFRGANREKGELNAAAWFTQPVDPADAPDYYSIIKNPMDFSTIRKKLESGQYAHFDDFHADMLLVRSNCFLYNLPSTLVCRDCVQVFNFYQQEIDRLLDKSTNKAHTGSPIKKIIRLDKSPGKS